MAYDQTLATMNLQRKQTVEAENAKTLTALSEVLTEQIQLAYVQLQKEDEKLLDPARDYNNHQMTLYLKLNLKDFHNRCPDGHQYRIYWQPSNLRTPQAMEVILRKHESHYDPDSVLGKLLTNCVLPVLEDFRQHLRQRYPGATVSSHFNGGEEPSIGINITYKFDYQQGIPLILNQKKTTLGGVIWSTEMIEQAK